MKITKIEPLTKDDFKQLEIDGDFIYCGNVHLFMETQMVRPRTNNPFGITFEQMRKAFGEPSFEMDDYDDASYWMLEWNGNKWYVDVNEHEGSGFSMYKELPDGKKNDPKVIKITFGPQNDVAQEFFDFNNQLFSQF
jgi:hypothetical protein